MAGHIAIGLVSDVQLADKRHQQLCICPAAAPSIILTLCSSLCCFPVLLQISYRTQRKRMAVLVSKMDHCLFDLLIRQRSGELHCDIPVVISNHPDLGHVANMFGVDFEHLGFRKDLDKAVAKQQQEAAIQRVSEHL
jgi:formyltetrahydrofolate hydrolase